jgi:hypothetical protein
MDGTLAKIHRLRMIIGELMRLRELKYPVANLRPYSLMGGRNATFSSRRRWDFNIAESYLKGYFDDAIIYDSEGHKFEAVKIVLSPSQWWYRLGDLAANFFLTRNKPDPTNVDMELRQIAQRSLDELRTELREVALANPSWWKRHSSEQEIRDMFKGCSTIAEAIDDIGVLDKPGKERPKGHSDKVVDLRN